MKTLNDYMAMSYRMEIIEDKDEGGFVVSYPDLPGCITISTYTFLIGSCFGIVIGAHPCFLNV